MKRILTAAILAFTLYAPALADTIPQGATLLFWEPVGNGDPNDISCYVGRETPPYRFVDCKRNWEWKRINAGLGRNRSDIGSTNRAGTLPDTSFGSPRGRELSGS